MASTSASCFDVTFEEELLRDPFALRVWWRYLQSTKAVGKGGAAAGSGHAGRFELYERALSRLPGSFKLWRAYLDERAAAGAADARVFERALATMDKKPRIWLMYLEFLSAPGSTASITAVRRSYDRALQALPVTQHARVWPLYIAWVTGAGVPTDTALRVYRRCLKLDPSRREAYVAFLRSRERWGEAARVLRSMLEHPDAGGGGATSSRHELWLELCDIITRHPLAAEETGMDVDAILRAEIGRRREEAGRLWTSLADYHIRRGLFENARDVFAEAIEKVATVRDFSLVYEAYARFEESAIAAAMEGGGGGEDPELDLSLERLEMLLSQRALLVNAVLLRQDPHSVSEWLKRATKLLPASGAEAAEIDACFEKALCTVDPDRASGGKVSSLWSSYAKAIEARDATDEAGAKVGSEAWASVYRRGVDGGRFRTPDDCATLWLAWCEAEMRHGRPKKALALAQEATARGAQCRRAPRLWLLLCDLTESLSTLEDTKAAYETVLDLKIATPQLVLNFASVMKEHRFFEEAFRVYEKGVGLFRYPHAKELWRAYLADFVSRYGGSKMERTRALFESALEAAPPEESREIYARYAAFEEAHGLAKNVMAIFTRGIRSVPASDKLSLYERYLDKASEFYGVPKLRAIYQNALEEEPPAGLQDAGVKAMCLKFAALERQLGEVDRARAVFRHGAQLADPKREPKGPSGFWDQWHAFEVAHGNEDTFRDMLRLKRSVAAFYSQTYQPSTALQAKAARAGGAQTRGKGPSKQLGAGMDSMQALEAERDIEPATIAGFVKGGTQGGTVTAEGTAVVDGGDGGEAAANPEDIDLDDLGDDGDGDGGEGGDGFALKEKAVPDAVFGAALDASGKRAGAPAVGAMERFKRAKTSPAAGQ